MSHVKSRTASKSFNSSLRYSITRTDLAFLSHFQRNPFFLEFKKKRSDCIDKISYFHKKKANGTSSFASAKLFNSATEKVTNHVLLPTIIRITFFIKLNNIRPFPGALTIHSRLLFMMTTVFDFPEV